MKILFAALVIMFSQQSFACADYNSEDKICPGDTVYKGSDYTLGAVVMGVNPYRKTATVRSNYSGNNASENVIDLHITRGCLDRVCVGELVFKGSEYTQGATVVAINPHKGLLTVKSVYSGNLAVESVRRIHMSRGCVHGICVGDKVYKGSEYTEGALVVGINHQEKTVTVKSVYSGNLQTENPKYLDITTLCADYSDYDRSRSMDY